MSRFLSLRDWHGGFSSLNDYSNARSVVHKAACRRKQVLWCREKLLSRVLFSCWLDEVLFLTNYVCFRDRREGKFCPVKFGRGFCLDGIMSGGLCPGTHSQSWWFSSNIHSLCCIGTVGSMDLRAWINGLISAGSELSVPVGQFSKSHSFAVIAVTNRYGDNWIIRQEHFMVSYYVTVGGI